MRSLVDSRMCPDCGLARRIGTLAYWHAGSNQRSHRPGLSAFQKQPSRHCFPLHRARSSGQGIQYIPEGRGCAGQIFQNLSIEQILTLLRVSIDRVVLLLDLSKGNLLCLVRVRSDASFVPVMSCQHDPFPPCKSPVSGRNAACSVRPLCSPHGPPRLLPRFSAHSRHPATNLISGSSRTHDSGV